MDKRFPPHQIEHKIYHLWEQGGYFKPEINKDGRPYCIIMPPPNANLSLHIGHARFVTIEDILIRYARMQGRAALWLPGTDHAGIETQYVFEKQLAKKGKSRFDYDRHTLYQMIWDHVQKYSHVSVAQMKALGASADWRRLKFTLDPDIVKIVYQTFKKLHQDNLLYRGLRLINYCTQCGTSFSQLEVNHIERQHPLYYIKYGPFTLATVRPETKFGDTAVAVHPQDQRYQKWIGKQITCHGLLGKFKLQVIADRAVDPQFGTGVVKVTPAHDPTDFAIGQRHHLEIKQVIDFDGRLNQHAGKYAGMPAQKARKIIAADLEKAGLIAKIDHRYTHSVAVCYKCSTPIEPLPKEQWFVKVKPLAKKALQAVQKGDTRIPVPQFKKVYNHWLKNIKDWNISRQVVWGIRIPAWRCQDCQPSDWIITNGPPPSSCPHCQGTRLQQDPDTFDTWFSSGQWPFATLQASKFPDDFSKFYPTQVMETGYDILPFWIIRMMMLGIYVTGQVPFRTIVLHGMVRDKHNQKISKSKGNVIDPLEMSQKYGTDALRMSLVYGTLIQHDIALSEDKIRAMRNFANKIWNIGRFVDLAFSSVNLQDVPRYEDLSSAALAKEDKVIIGQLNSLIKATGKHLENFNISQAANLIYDFTWHQLADVYLEKIKDHVKLSTDSKQRTTSNQLVALSVLRHVYFNTLKLLHPFMPFVTESLWQELKNFRRYPRQPLIISRWPEAD